MFQCKLTKLSKIKFVDDGVCGDTYKENGTKYYSIECSFESIDESNYHKFKNVYLLLPEEELNKLINEPFYYNKNDKKIIFTN